MLGDFNGDGKVDLASSSDTGVSIFPGNGDGTFQPAVNTGIPGGLSVFEVRDFNHDGKADLACGSVNQGPIILLGNGDGTFRPPINYGVTNSEPYSIVSEDFDGDGKPGFGSRLQCSRTFSIFLGNDDGTYNGQRPMLRSQGRRVATASILFRRLRRRLNGDGRSDLAVTDVCGDVYILFGATATQLRFATQQAGIPAGTNLPAVVVQVQDTGGNVVMGVGTLVTLTSNPAGINTTAAIVNGVAASMTWLLAQPVPTS